eukprot:7223166-Ditylum_brightwellii.AAC.1
MDHEYDWYEKHPYRDILLNPITAFKHSSIILPSMILIMHNKSLHGVGSINVTMKDLDVPNMPETKEYVMDEGDSSK